MSTDLTMITPSRLEDTKYRGELSESLSIDIDDACVTLNPTRRGNRLGMSSIGEPCARKLWYDFRWVKQEEFNGRMLRLFERGNLEEKRFIEWLQHIGCEVRATDENGKQFDVSDVNGHLGGRLDGCVLLPPRYKIKEWLLVEFKTWKQDAKWNKLRKEGVYKAVPKHYSQMCVYGFQTKLRHALYLAINKNNDEIYLEIIPLSWQVGEEMVRKAEEIITASHERPPVKISQQRTHFSCKWCVYNDICHDNDEIDRNCRSCQFAETAEQGEWFCKINQANIPKDFLEKGCDQYQPIQ